MSPNPELPVLGSDEDCAKAIDQRLFFTEGYDPDEKVVEIITPIIARHTAARTAELRKDVEYWQHVAGDAQIKAKELEARTGKLVEALQFYADEETHKIQTLNRMFDGKEQPGNTFIGKRVDLDKGAVARAALGGSE